MKERTIEYEIKFEEGDRDDPGGYRRLAAIEGWVYTRPVKRKSMTFYFVYLKTAISVQDTLKCS